MGIPNLTEKLKSVKQSAVPDHLPQCNCLIDFDYFDILASDTNKFNELIVYCLFVYSLLNVQILFLWKLGIKFEIIYQFGVFGSNSMSDVENYKFNIGYLVDQPEELVASFCLEHTNII